MASLAAMTSQSRVGSCMKDYYKEQDNLHGLSGSVSDPDPHKEMPPGSGSAWTDADPDSGGKKA